MALIATIRINSTGIGMLYAQRIAGTTDPDSVGTYRADVSISDTPDGPPNEIITVFDGEVTHRFGDGAWALVARVIAAAGLDEPGGAARLRADAIARFGSGGI